MASELMLSDLRKHGSVYLVITLDNDAPDDYVSNWTKIVSTFNEMGEKERDTCAQIAINKCKLESNRQRKVLGRRESGIGGSTGNNTIDKQIRFDHPNKNHRESIWPFSSPEKIILTPIDSDIEFWSLTELTDFLQAFREEFDDILESHGGVRGYIHIEPRDEEE